MPWNFPNIQKKTNANTFVPIFQVDILVPILSQSHSRLVGPKSKIKRFCLQKSRYVLDGQSLASGYVTVLLRGRVRPAPLSTRMPNTWLEKQ